VTTALYTPDAEELISYAERTGVQIRTAEALVDLLTKARAEDLPPLVWRINDWVVEGSSIFRTPDESYVAQERWADFLDAKPARLPRVKDRVSLYASRIGWNGDPHVTIAITHEFPDHEELISNVVQ
jgi:hypothetical protein